MEIPPQKHGQQYASENPEAVYFANKYPLRILVIENALLNQYVLTHLLIYFGYIVTTLDNVHDFFQEIKKHFFDLIFIDLHLVESLSIFSEEFLKEKNAPVILLGKVNKQSDYQQYLESGLDDYLSIPTTSKQLELVLRHWHFRNNPKNNILPLERFNTAQFLMRVGYNVVALQEMIELFSEDKQRLLHQIHSALLKKDTSLLKKATHELKGICSTLSAKELKQLTIEIEVESQKKGFLNTFSTFERLEKECNQIHSALTDFQKALQEELTH